ncbi:putative NBD/HSP70 family sugar kinase [Humibacillus xanthopallidus]|uniref:Putative NBD/HSP70 family sugar kinase n=1 Tax=Humibacillus xanthopallidus TaxID=412689 RepID=A0A543PNB5_9MICO|nr:ROK family transcriptional regulator [Humibacillus xanthopallidus]TQN45574.1 putative NBD/HSP70 family sugar kinase [Humibacillus xanthopallidus]
MTTALPRARRVSPRTAMLPAHGRRHNLSLVLQMLYTVGAMSRADLARRLGMSKVTVSDLVAELIESGHAVELGPSGQVRPGKPATLVDVNRTGLQAIGVDLAAHRVLRAAVLDLDGNILARAERPIGDDTGDAITQRVLELVDEIVSAATAPILGIGVGTPGIVVAGGVVDTAPNLGWRDVPLRDLIADATGLPVFVVNDADAAVHADYTLGNGGDDLVLVKIGRGVGCGLIVGGQRVRGAHFAAGEIGHVTVGTDGGAVCRCGKTGCLETWVSAPRLEQALATAGDDSPLREAGERLGIALAPVVAVLDLAEVVLSGPGHLLDGPLRDSVEQTLRDRLLARPEAELTVRIAHDSDDIVLRGAAVLVLWDQLGVV